MGSAGAAAVRSTEAPANTAKSASLVAWALSALLLLAALLRLVPLIARSYVGDADQVVYLDLAEELLRGNYPTGDFGPGFAAVVALLRLVGVPLLWAGQVASLTFGLLLIYLCFALARRLFGAAAGLTMAFLIAVHAWFVDSSISGMSESALLVALVAGILLLLRSGVTVSTGKAALTGSAAGLLFGYGYLVRPDAALYAAVLCLSLLILANLLDANPIRSRIGAFMAIVITLVIVSLNTFAIWRETGEIRPQQRRMAQASVYDLDTAAGSEQALFAIWSGAKTPETPADESLPKRVKRLIHNSYDSYLHAIPEGLDPALMLAAGFGLILLLLNAVTRWQTLWLTTAWLVFPALSVAYAARVRHIAPLIAIGLVWAAYGLWSASRLSFSGNRLQTVPPAARRTRLAVVCALVLLFQLKPNADLTQAALNGEVPKEEKTAGEWLKAHARGAGPVLERKSIVGWYAGLPSLVPPPSNLADVYAFAKQRQARYLIVSERRLDQRPFLRPLLDPKWRGSANFRRIYESSPTRREPMKLVIYEIVAASQSSVRR